MFDLKKFLSDTQKYGFGNNKPVKKQTPTPATTAQPKSSVMNWMDTTAKLTKPLSKEQFKQVAINNSLPINKLYRNLNKTTDASQFYSYLRDAEKQGVIDKKQHIKLLQSYDDASQKLAKQQIADMLSPGKILSEVTSPYKKLTTGEYLQTPLQTVKLATENPYQFGKNMVSGMQQSAGNVADVAVQGGGVIQSLGSDLNPFLSQQQKEKNIVDIVNNTERVRNMIKGAKTATGESYNPNPDFQKTGDFWRDTANLGGRGLQVGLDATQYINPTGTALSGSLATGKALYRPIAREMALYGIGQGLATGAKTYGQTGDIGQSINAGANDAIMGTATQGAIELGAVGLKKLMRGIITTGLVDNARANILAKTQNMIEPNYNALDLGGTGVINDFADYRLGEYPPKNMNIVNELGKDAYTAAKKARILSDIVTGSPIDAKRTILNYIKEQDIRDAQKGQTKQTKLTPEQVSQLPKHNIGYGKTKVTHLTPLEVDKLLKREKQKQKQVGSHINPLYKGDKTKVTVTKEVPAVTPENILYHGSNAKFNKFDINKFGTGEGADRYGRAAYLTDNKDLANFYANAVSKKGFVDKYTPTGPFGTDEPIYKVGADLSAKKVAKVNEFIYKDLNIFDVEKSPISPKVKDVFINDFIERGYSKEQATKAVNDIMDFAKNNKDKINNYRGELDYMITQVPQIGDKVANVLKSEGYDGVKYLSDKNYEGKGGYNYAIYNTDKLQSKLNKSTPQPKSVPAITPNYTVKQSSKGNIYIKKDNGEVVTNIPKTIQGDLYAKSRGEVLSPDRAMKLDDFLNKKTVTQEVPIVGKKLTKTVSPKASQTAPKARGFVESVQQAQNVDKAVKKSVEGLYTPKTNDTLMGEAKGLLNEGVEIDFKGVKDLDKKVAATMQEAMNQQAAGNHQAAADLYNNLSEKGTELGRGVQAFNLLENMSPEAVSLSVAGKIKKFNRLNPTKKIPELTGDQAKMISDKITAADLLKGNERNIALHELEQTLNDFIPSTFADKAITVWKAGLLTSLRTHARNFVGNTIHGISEIAKDVPASIADIVMSAKTGKRTLSFRTKGVREFASKSTLQQMKDIISKGYDPSQIIDKFDYKKTTWAKTKPQQALKKYTDFVFNTLGAEDKPFYNSAMARSLYDQASAEAINAGRRGDKAFINNLVNNPTDDMFKTAVGDANVAVFKDKNAANKVVSGLKQAMGKTEVGKIASEVTMPFTGVPTSILGQIQAYSPIGLVKGIYKSGKVIAGQVPELQRKAAQELGRGVIGTGIFGLGAYLSSKGLITGQPKDADEAKQWELENKPRNSIFIGGKWRSLNSIGPEAVVFLAGAKLSEEMNNPEGSAANYATTLGKDYLDQSFVQGLQSPVNALTDPARYGKSYLGQTISSVEPNIIKDLAKATDTSQREMNTVEDYIKGNIPGVRNTMTVKRDVLGNELKQEPTGAMAFIDLFNSKTPVSNRVVDELGRLYKAGQSATPSKLSKSQTIGGEKVTLTPEELDKLEAKSGKAVSQQMDELMKTPEYKSASDEMKKKTLDTLVTDIRDSAKSSVANKTTLTVSKASKKAQLALAKDAFDASGKNFQVVGDTVLRRGSDGTITATLKIKYEYQLNTSKMTQYKNNDDLNGYLQTAKLQLESINKQLQDPSVDPKDAIDLQNDAQSIMDNITKYTEYGGFTKPKSGSKGKKVTRLDYTKSMVDVNAEYDALRKLVTANKITRKKVGK